MRVNVYAEEITDKVELVEKDGRIGVRFWMYLPVTLGTAQVQGPFVHKKDDDDSSAITFWGKRELKVALRKALELLEETAPASTNTTPSSIGIIPPPIDRASLTTLKDKPSVYGPKDMPCKIDSGSLVCKSDVVKLIQWYYDNAHYYEKPVGSIQSALGALMEDISGS